MRNSHSPVAKRTALTTARVCTDIQSLLREGTTLPLSATGREREVSQPRPATDLYGRFSFIAPIMPREGSTRVYKELIMAMTTMSQLDGLAG